MIQLLLVCLLFLPFGFAAFELLELGAAIHPPTYLHSFLLHICVECSVCAMQFPGTEDIIANKIDMVADVMQLPF